MSRASRPTIASVNLLSPWAFEAMAVRRLRRRFALGAVALVLLLAGGWAVQHLRAVQAEQVLAIEEAERATLTSQTAELAPVRTFVAAVAKRKETVSGTMSSEVRFSRVLSELALATPADATLTNLAVTLTPPSAAGTDGAADAAEVTTEAPADPAAAATTASACPGPDPFGATTVVGCLTLSGEAAGRDAVGQLVVDLDRSPLFVEPFISTTTTAEGATVTFTGTVGLSPKALTGRYKDLDTLLSERSAR